MKKLLSILAMALILVACEGPMGPMGPQGEPGEGMNWKVYDFTISADKWELVGEPDGIGSYYMYVFENNHAPAELAQVIQYKGEVTGFYLSHLDNGDEVLAPLPYIVYDGISNEQGLWLWSEQYTFDYTRNSVAFYALYNDFATEQRPMTLTFRLSLKW